MQNAAVDVPDYFIPRIVVQRQVEHSALRRRTSTGCVHL